MNNHTSENTKKNDQNVLTENMRVIRPGHKNNLHVIIWSRGLTEFKLILPTFLSNIIHMQI